MEKFLINEDEKSRILNMHIDRTSKHYLIEQEEEDEVEEVYEEVEFDDDTYEKNMIARMGGRGYTIKVMDSDDGEPIIYIKSKKSALPELVDELSRFAKNVGKY
jgi:hypothetical protein